MERASSPVHMGLVVAQNPPEPARGKCVGNIGEPQDLTHHEQHHKSAVGIKCNVAASGSCERNRRDIYLFDEPFIYFNRLSC